MPPTANLRYLTARVARRHALLEAIRQRAPSPITSAELAKRLEVSTRTIERDVASLTAVGVPIRAERGHGGGYRLVVPDRPVALELSAVEVSATLASLAELGPHGTAATSTTVVKLIEALELP